MQSEGGRKPKESGSTVWRQRFRTSIVFPADWLLSGCDAMRRGKDGQRFVSPTVLHSASTGCRIIQLTNWSKRKRNNKKAMLFFLFFLIHCLIDDWCRWTHFKAAVLVFFLWKQASVRIQPGGQTDLGHRDLILVIVTGTVLNNWKVQLEVLLVLLLLLLFLGSEWRRSQETPFHFTDRRLLKTTPPQQ